MTKIFKKAKMYTTRIMDCLEIISELKKDYLYQHKSYCFQHLNDGRIYIKVKNQNSLFYKEVISYYPGNINLKNTTDAMKINHVIDLDKISQEYEFQLKTLYTDEELLDIYISELLNHFSFDGYIYYNKNMPFNTITKAKTNIENYIENSYELSIKTNIQNKRFKSKIMERLF